MSKFGMPSATATTSYELITIIEKEIGIFRLPRTSDAPATASARSCTASLSQSPSGGDGNFCQEMMGAAER
jgi:hypothetical protein